MELPLGELFVSTFANTPHQHVRNCPGGNASVTTFTEHCVSKYTLSHVLANHLSLAFHCSILCLEETGTHNPQVHYRSKNKHDY